MKRSDPGLADRLAGLIREAGPIDVARFMEICLHDPEGGYYATQPALGERGDFITAPLVSQMFGECLGAWVVEAWARLGGPSKVRLIELGPGDGTMLSDVLRAARSAPAFLEACEPWLVERSVSLRALQNRALAQTSASWVETLGEVPADAPVILLANEFLDCLPVRQAVLTRDGWRERRVGLDAGGALTFTAGEVLTCDLHGFCDTHPAPPGSVAEWSPALAAMGGRVGALVARASGAALFIDYGRSRPGLGDTLQALRRHRRQNPLADPGAADLTVHVDFPAFLAAARAAGADTSAICEQGAFLRGLGVAARADVLARSRPDRAETIGRQLDRLVAPDQMGRLFKVASIHVAGFAPPGLETVA